MSLTLTPVTPVTLTAAAVSAATLTAAAVSPASLTATAAPVRSGAGSYYGSAHYGVDMYGATGFTLASVVPGSLVLVPA